MGKIDPNEAPPGCFAVPAKKIEDFDWDCYECGECHFEGSINEICDRAECSAEARNDGRHVKFILKPVPTATASWPCDDMGTPVEVVE